MLPSLENVAPSMESMVFSAQIGGMLVRRIYIDGGSASGIMYEHCFSTLPKYIQSQLSTITLTGFTGDTLQPLGQLTLSVTLKGDHLRRTEQVTFLVVNRNSRYNILFGRPAIGTFGAVVSTTHAMIKFPTTNGIATIPSEEQEREFVTSVAEANEDSQWRINDAYPDQMVSVGPDLTPSVREKLYNLLRNNNDVFAWTINQRQREAWQRTGCKRYAPK
jgi:hypothetical protein